MSKCSANAGKYLNRMALALAVACAVSVGETQAVVLTDGNTTFEVDLNSSAGLKQWTVDGVNQAKQQWFWYRVGPDGAESDLTSITTTPTVSTFGTRQVTATYANQEYGVRVRYQIMGGATGSGTSGYSETITLYNYTSSPREFHFFQYSDFDLGGTAGNQYAQVYGNPGAFTEVLQTLGNQSLSLAVGDQQQSMNPVANGAEAGLASATLGKLTDALPTTLIGPVVAGPGDVAWALQWDFVIAPYSSVPISLTSTLQVPEPSALALLALGFGAWVLTIWRKNN